MNFTDAIRESMGRYLDGRLSLAEIEKTQETPIKFSPDYFDEIEKALEDTPEEEVSDEGNA